MDSTGKPHVELKVPDEEIKRQRLARARLLSRTGQSAQALEMALA